MKHHPSLLLSSHRPRPLHRRISAIALPVIALLAPAVSHAQLYWDTNGTTAGTGTPGTAVWNTGATWSGDATGVADPTFWVDGSTAIFSAGGDPAGAWAISISGSVQTNAIIFAGTGNTTHTISGGTIDGGIGNLLFDATAAGAAGGRSKTISAVIAGSGGVTIAANGDISNTGGGSNTVFALSGANVFTGGVTITSGVVSAASNFGDFSNAVKLDGGGLVATVNTTLARNLEIGAAGGTLRSYGAVTNFTLSGNITGTGTINRTDGGTAIFTGDLSGFSGTFRQSAGTAVFASATSPTGLVEVNAGTIWIGNNGTDGTLKNASAINLAAGTNIYIRRSDTINATDVLPSTINFAGGYNVEFNPTVATGVLNFDRALGADTAAGQLRVSGGTLKLGSAANVITGTISVGLQTAANRGVLEIADGATVLTRFMDLGNGNNNSGTVNQTGGTVTIQSGGNGFRLGHWANGTSPGTSYNLSGGVLDGSGLIGNAGDLQLMNIGWDGLGTMVVGGGAGSATLKAVGIMLDRNRAGAGSTASTLTVSPNGTVEIGTRGTIGVGANDAIILNGGTLRAVAASTWSAELSAASGTNSIIDTNGMPVTINRSLTGTGTIEVNDSVGAGPLVFDSGAGTLNVAPGIGGSAQISKIGAGTLVLTGLGAANGFFAVNAGILSLKGGYTGTVSVGDGAAIEGEGVAGLLVMGSTTGATLRADPVTPGALTVAGDVFLSAPTAIAFTTGPTVVGAPITVLQYGGGIVAPENLVLPGADKYRAAVITSDPGKVTVSLGNKNLVWNGTSGGEWQVGGVQRWNASEADAFYWGDTTRFDETGATTAITVTGEVQPSVMVVDSVSKNYSFTGSAGNFIGGPGTLIKKGSSILTINASNTYTGGTVISAGTIDIQNAGSLGVGTVTVGDAESGSADISLYLKPLDNTTAGRVNFARQVIVSSAATGTVTLGSRTSTGGAADNHQFTNIVLQRDVIFDSNSFDRTDYENISGTGNIIVKGTGRSMFMTVNTFVGDLTVLGSLQLGANSGALNVLPDTTNVTVTAPGLFNLSFVANTTETINTLNGNGTVGNNGGNANILGIGGATGTGDFSGLIRNGGAGAFGITKVGANTQTLSGLANTYTGVTTVNGGVLAASVIANGGVNSSIGASTNAATNLVVNGGTLRHTGTAATTDRLFTIGTGGGGIEASGTGPLVIANTGAVVLAGTNAARTFTLGGTNTGDNTFASILGNNGSGATGFTKSGAGTWLVTGANTYTGVTTVAGGILSVNTLANGGVTSPLGQAAKAGANLVLNGGTLRYTGATVATDRAFQTGATGGAIDVSDPAAAVTFGSSGTTFALAGTLTKTGPGTLRLVSYTGSTAAAASDLSIQGGVVEFGTGYFNASPFGYRALSINVAPGGILRTTTAHALGGDNIDAGTSWGQVRLLGGTAQFNGSQYISGGTVNGEGRLVLEGGIVEGSADLRGLNSTVTVLPSATTSEIRNSGGISLQYGGLTFDVADGVAVTDLAVKNAITSTNGITKMGAGLMELSAMSNYAGQTAVYDGTLSVSGSITGAVTVAGGTLDGIGSVGGVSLNLGTVTAGGKGIGNLATKDLFLSGGTMAFDLSETGSDQLLVTGSVAFGGPVELALRFSNAFTEPFTFTLVNNDDIDGISFGSTAGLYLGGTLIEEGVDFAYTSGAATQIFHPSYEGGDGNDFTLTVVPEPGSAVLLLGGMGAVLGFKRRRREGGGR